jgi:hypothetical protein
LKPQGVSKAKKAAHLCQHDEKFSTDQTPDFFVYRTPRPLANFHIGTRLLGPRGLLHQQSVFPIREAPRLLDALLTDCRDMGEPPCLASIKLFGSRRPVGLLSFPREGFTIALDFANRGETTRRLLRRLEARVLEAGGAIYPAKDSTLSPEGFRRSFPAWESFVPHIDPHFSSSFWRRVVGIQQGGRPALEPADNICGAAPIA